MSKRVRTRPAAKIVKLISLLTLMVFKELVLFVWLPSNKKMTLWVSGPYDTSPIHSYLSLAFIILNISWIIIISSLIKDVHGFDIRARASTSNFFAFLVIASFIMVLAISGVEARVVCQLLGLKHTGWLIG